MKSVSSDFTTAFEQPTMQVLPRLLMEFGNNRFNTSGVDDQVCTASSTKIMNRGIENSYQTSLVPFWSTYDCFNNKNRNSMRWAVLDHGAVARDESAIDCYRAIDADDTDQLGSPVYERGWWSANKSNGSGIFSSPEWVQSTWTDTRPINRVTLYTMEGFPNMKSVTVQYHDANSNTWIAVATAQILGSNSYINSWDISVAQCNGLRVYFNSTYANTDFARCNELQGYLIEDISADIISIDIDQQREEFVNTVPVGIARSNTANLTVQNVDQKYSQTNSSSPYYPYVEAQNRFTIEFGIKKADTTFEYTPMGEFWVDEWDTDGSTVEATANCRDFGRFLQDEKVFNIGKVWQKTTVIPVIRDVLARAGKSPDEININPTDLRVYDIIFLKDKTFWSFMTELAFADQGTYGFDETGEFFYESYKVVNEAPNDSSVWDLDWDTNIVSASQKTELFINSVIVKVSQYKTANLTSQIIWEATPADTLDIPNNTTVAAVLDNTLTTPSGSEVVLTWNFLQSNITDTATTIPVTLNNTTQNFDNNFGYILIGHELIHYDDRTDSSFTNCTRGFGNTQAVAHSSGALVGRAKYWEAEWTTAPAIDVKYPFVSAIDSLLLNKNEGTAQAAIILFDRNAFGGKIAIGNIVPFYTILKGKGRSQKIDDPNLDWAAEIVGRVAVQKGVKEEIGGVTGKTVSAGRNIKYIRRYGKNEIVIDNPWIESRQHALDIQQIYLDEYKKPRPLIDVKIVGYPALQQNDRVTITNYPELDIVNLEANIVAAKYSYDGGLTCDMTIRGIKE